MSMSHPEATLELDVKPVRSRQVRWYWWLLLVLAAAVAIVVWPRSGPLDSRLIGEWTFLTTDGTGIRKFLTLSRDGTARLERVRPGSTERTPDTGLMNWWMERDVLVTQNVVDPVTKAHQVVADVITLIRLKKREDRSAFRLKVIHVDEKTLRVSEATTPAVPPLEIELTRVEDSK
jgi:hypothetical protein